MAVPLAAMRRHMVQDHIVRFDTGRSVLFPFPVAETLEYADVTIVRLGVPPEAAYDQNVFGVDFEGTIVWQVPRDASGHSHGPYTTMQRNGEDVVLSKGGHRRLAIHAATGDVVAEEDGR